MRLKGYTFQWGENVRRTNKYFIIFSTILLLNVHYIFSSVLVAIIVKSYQNIIISNCVIHLCLTVHKALPQIYKLTNCLLHVSLFFVVLNHIIRLSFLILAIKYTHHQSHIDNCTYLQTLTAIALQLHLVFLFSTQSNIYGAFVSLLLRQHSSHSIINGAFEFHCSVNIFGDPDVILLYTLHCRLHNLSKDE